MILLVILFQFLLPTLVILMAMFRFGVQEKASARLSILAALGVAPLSNGLLMYYLVSLFPGNGDRFYVISLVAFWGLAISLAAGAYKDALSSCVRAFSKFSDMCRPRIPFGTSVYGIIIASFFSLYSIQALVYPIIDGDNARYINQAKAIYEQRNFDWQKSSVVTINGDDYYTYNPMIRPAVPFFMAVSYLFAGESQGTFVYQFLHWYYFVLLFSVVGVAIDLFHGEVGRKAMIERGCDHMYWGALLIIFSWGLARLFIFGLKESIIYFFVVLSLILISKLIKGKAELSKNTDYTLPILLATIVGLNMFVNLHGIIIAALLMIVLFLFGNGTLLGRVTSVLIIFAMTIPFGGFEFFSMFHNVFLVSLESFWKYISPHQDIIVGGSTVNTVGASPSNAAATSVADISYDKTHMELFQFSSWGDYYVKGKLQVLFNVGYFGFSFWLFLAILISRFREILSTGFGKVMLSFMGLYFVVVIDPFSLNRNAYSIVLWGSQKYSMVLFLLGLIILSVYMGEILRFFQGIIIKRIVPVLIGFVALPSLLYFRIAIVDFGFALLSKSVQFYKEADFYMNIVSAVYWFGILLLVVTMLILSLSILLKNEVLACNFASGLFAACFILFPFFLTNPGKVPLHETLVLLGSDKSVLLKSSLYEGDIFSVYYYAKSALPKGSALVTDYSEVYLYDDYFSLSEKSWLTDAGYTITGSCMVEKTIYKSGNISLCSS